MTASDITIAVTVFDRRAYIKQAIESALAQTMPVRVVVVEDCGPDATLRDFVLETFGSRIEYVRNPRRRGLFGNWNACMDLCRTEWLCILHDDDFLEPNFVETMLELANKIPGKGLYYGRCHVVTQEGQWAFTPAAVPGPESQATNVVAAALQNPLSFPCDLFRVECAVALGGFRVTSFYTGDWDMWVKLALHYGGAGTSRVVGNLRGHRAVGKGTMRVVRNGKVMPFTYMQLKKNVSLLKQNGIQAHFDRLSALRHTTISTRFLLENSWRFSSRLLRYNVRLHLLSPTPHLGHHVFKLLTRCFGTAFVRLASFAYTRVKGI